MRLLKLEFFALLALLLAIVAPIEADVIVGSSSSSSSSSDDDDEPGMILIFVDVDGVLAPWPTDPSLDVDDDTSADPTDNICYNDVPDHTLKEFAHLLSHIEEGRREVVLSSSWRNAQRCIDLILQKFHDYGNKHPHNSLV